MAKVEQTSTGKWQAIVQKTDPYKKELIRKTQSFLTKAAAEKWATDIEYHIERGDLKKTIHAAKTVTDALDRYERKVTLNKACAKWESKKIKYLKTLPIAKIKLSELTREDVSDWKDFRLKSIQGESLLREWTVLNSVLNYVIEDLGWFEKNPMRSVRKPPKGDPRDIVFLDNDLAVARHVSGYHEDEPPEKVMPRVCAALLFGVETAIRSTEMTKITWDMVLPDRIRLPKEITKEKKKRTVPLSPRAQHLVQQFYSVKKDNTMLRLTPDQISSNFRNIRIKGNLNGLTFRDSRATALTRLSKLYENPMELAKISGHRKLSTLLNTYYRPDEDDLVSKLSQFQPSEVGKSTFFP